MKFFLKEENEWLQSTFLGFTKDFRACELSFNKYLLNYLFIWPPILNYPCGINCNDLSIKIILNQIVVQYNLILQYLSGTLSCTSNLLRRKNMLLKADVCFEKDSMQEKDLTNRET